MQKQLGKIGTVRVRSVEKRTHGSKRSGINVLSSPLTPQENRVCVSSAASTAVLDAPTTMAEGMRINLSLGSTTPQENRGCVLTAAGTTVPEAPTTMVESIRINVPSKPLVPQENRACVSSAAGTTVPEVSTTTMERYREHAMTEILKGFTITMLFVAWRSYRARMRQKREAIQMLALSCVVRRVDVELRYTTSLQRMGVCIGDPDTQPFHDLTPSLYLQPLTTTMRARGKQLLEWLRHELTAKYTQHVWKEMEIWKRRWQPSSDQTQRAKA